MLLRLADFGARLAEERDTLAAIMENTPEAHLAYLDPDFDFVLVNSTYAKGSGVPKEELVGRNHFDLFPSEENEAIFRRALDTGEPVAFHAKPFVFELQPWRGVTYWDWTLTPIKDADGRVRGLVFSLVDVTERTRGQQLSEALADLDSLVHSTLRFDEVMRELIERAAKVVGCESVALALRDGDGWEVTFVRDSHDPCVQRNSIPAEDIPMADLCVRTRGAVMLDDGCEDERLREAMERFGVKSTLVVPLFVSREAVGVIGFQYHSEAMPFPEPVVRFAERLAASASLALSNARLYEQEHRAAEALRISLVRPVPTPARLDLGVVYRPAFEADRVGGDFYDVFEVDDGRLAVLVGDVSGKGLAAAGLSETARSTVRALAYLEPSPGAVVTRMNETLRRQLEPGVFVTAVFAVIDPLSGEAVITSAGHPPPVVCGGGARFVDMRPGVVLGAFRTRYAETRLALDDRALLFYTDGVTDVRRDGLRFGRGRLARAVRGAGSQETVESVLAAISEFGRGKLPDDVAMVAVRRISA